tara:strand:+ start:17822 stop:19021 length:1200 start_codon:yes stop_codon:yes gene_type:complete
MKRWIIENYVESYKENFDKVNEEELYKWKAIKQFQDNWNIEANDFSEMLKESLRLTKNLLGSGNYYPRRVINKIAKADPRRTKALLDILFNEELDLKYRFDQFKTGTKALVKAHVKQGNPYQDDRALMVYLSLRYPERYHLYKYTMFKDFTLHMDIPYKVVAGRFSNVLKFQDVCLQLKEILVNDDVLLKLHHDRLGEDCYQDPNYSILVQDFIYACVKHLQKIEVVEEQNHLFKEEFFEFQDFIVEVSESNFKGGKVDHLKKQVQNRIIGRAGEDYVLKNEINKLKMRRVKDIYSKVIHTSVVEGDGKGYDIQSVDDNGNIIFIEVKATTGAFNSPFYITRTELECSRINPKNYRLYRIYEFNKKKNQGKLKIFKGCIEPFCKQPENYKVKLNSNTKK